MIIARARSRLGASPNLTSATSNRSLFAAMFLPLLMIIHKRTRADEASVRAQLGHYDSGRVTWHAHRTFLEDVSGRIEQGSADLRDAAAQDNDLWIENMSDIDQSCAEGLGRFGDDGTRLWYPRLGC